MLYCGIIGKFGIECLLSARNRIFFIVELSDEQRETIRNLMISGKEQEAIRILKGDEK